MLKNYTFVIIILLVSSLSIEQTVEKGVITIQPSALQLLRRYFNPIVVLFHRGTNKEIEDKFMEVSRVINSTYPQKELLFGIINLDEDVNNVLAKYTYTVPCVQIITKKFNYPFIDQDLQKLINFYSQTVYPVLPKGNNVVASGRHNIVFSYTNQTQYLWFQQLYRRMREELFEYNVDPVATLNNSKQIHIVNTQGLVVKYESDLQDYNNILQYINLETIPEVTTLNEENYYRVFGSGIDKQVVLIINQSAQSGEEIEQLRKIFAQVANYNKYEELKYQRMIFAISTMRFSEEFFGDMVEDLSDSKFKILITRTDFQAFQLERYLYNKDTFDRTSLLEFLQDFRLKRLKPFYRSEKRPTEQQGELVKIVGKTFQEVIYHSKESVLVLFVDSKDPDSYIQWQKETVKFATKFKEFLSDKLIVGKFDLALNEHELLHLDFAPQLILFQKTNKKKARSFRGQVTDENIKEWTNYWIKDLNIPDNFGKQTLALGGGDL